MSDGLQNMLLHPFGKLQDALPRKRDVLLVAGRQIPLHRGRYS